MNGEDRSILLVDDHAVVREGYRSVLQKQPGLRVVAEAADGAEAYRLYKTMQPDLVIMDMAPRACLLPVAANQDTAIRPRPNPSA